MWRYFDAMQATLERHGGTVEKFIGDAIVAVFGVPAVHEDDALRAVRAAFEMQEALERVNEELAARVRGSHRDAHRRQHGRGDRRGRGRGSEARDRRRGQRRGAARAGRRCRARCSSARRRYRPRRDAVVVEPAAGRATRRGRAEPLAAWRLLGAAAGRARVRAPHRHPVRRSRPRARRGPPRVRHRGARALVPARHDRRAARDRQVAPRARSSSRSLEQEARVVVGRCVAYGEGITYLPLAEVVREVAGADPESALDGAPGERRARRGRDAADHGRDRRERRAGLARGDRVGVPPALRDARASRGRSSSSWTTSTGPSRRCSTCSSTSLGFSSGAPILLLCLARPDLFDARPSWAAPRPRDERSSRSRR